MDARPGIRLRARGLIWDVIEVDRDGDGERLSLRCVDGDMAGLEWNIFVPPDHVEPIDLRFDLACPAPLSLWHLRHRAHVLNQILDATSIVARTAGRLRVEPYQLVPLQRALDMPRPRLLLADGVGLGKTIQAGLIAAELIARRRAHRILIVVPSGPLLWQWEQETRLRFGLKFTLVTNAAELWEVRRAHELGGNPFDTVALCITALDFAKQDHVLEELERTTWDLVIIDEAHHCVSSGPGASSENTYRRKLAEVLAGRSDGLLLLSATPHDGNDAHFASLIALLDPSLVNGVGGLVGREYRRHVVRRMKLHIRDPGAGTPLFHRRRVLPVKVDVEGDEHETVREFHRALSAFVVPRLRRRTAGEDSLAFVSLLKRSVSTIAACLETLRVVADRLAGGHDGVDSKAARRERARALRAWRRRVARFGSLSATEDDGQTALEVEGMTAALRLDTDHELGRLIQLGAMAEPRDPKLEALIMEVRLIRMSHQKANILIYTEYTDSLHAAAKAVRSASGIGGEVLTIDGQDEDRVRSAAAQRFSEQDTLILLSTDTLAEGLNLQNRCFHLIHLDLPYNPNRLEQRNGRIDRYGQRQEPEIRYLYLPGTFEESLLLHLIAKYERARASLDVMPETLGVTAALDSGDASLVGRLSEDPDDLFKSENAAIRTLDQALVDSSPETIASLMREIDQGFRAFELMAVCHGWFGTSGLNADQQQLVQVERALAASPEVEDLTDFVAAVIAVESDGPTARRRPMTLPREWSFGLEGLPGFESAASFPRLTHDLDCWSDHTGQTMGFLGRAHPLVLRAIRRGCQLPGTIAVRPWDHLGLLFTFELEIRVGHRAMFREIIAVLACPDRPPAQVEQWLSFGHDECRVSDIAACDHLFVSWSQSARSEAEAVLSRIAAERHTAFADKLAAFRNRETARLNQWLRVRANQLCGPPVTSTRDMFGGTEPSSIWRHEPDSRKRLISFATDPRTTSSDRRMANDVLEIVRRNETLFEASGPTNTRPVGMLMLVPKDVF